MIGVVNRLRGRAHAIGQSRFVRNVAAVATGIAAAQAISLAFMPFLTRLYGPEAFGALAAFTAVVNIITPLATLGYANAIVMPETEEGATAALLPAIIPMFPEGAAAPPPGADVPAGAPAAGSMRRMIVIDPTNCLGNSVTAVVPHSRISTSPFIRTRRR